MENFIVSARKYRPMTFDTVVGQGGITTTLKNAIANQQLAQAYLFCGPRGVGKTTCARIFAKTINCLNLTEDLEACGECESCRAFNENRSYNIHELDAASNNSVDDIRQLIEKVRIPPQIGKYSIYIVDEVHMLSAAAFNAFLKTLEEPPSHAKFILATTEKHKILPTILSRCQIFDFNRMKIENITSHLQNLAQKEGIEADVDGLNVIAQKADGGMRDALSFFDQIVSCAGKKFTYKDVIDNLNVLDFEYYFKLVDCFLKGDVPNSLLTFNEIINKGFDAHHFVSGLSQHFRDLMVCKDEVTLELLEQGANIKERYRLQSKETSLNFLYNALNISNRCDLDYRESKSKRLLVELMLMQLCQLQNIELRALNVSQIVPQTAAQPIAQPSTQQTVQNQIEQSPNSQTNQPKVEATPKVSYIPPSQMASNQAQTAQTAPTKTGISIKDFLNKKNLQNLEQSQVQNTSATANQAATLSNEVNDFTREQLMALWKKLAAMYKDKKPRLHAIFTSSEPQILDDYQIEITLQNSFQEEALNEVKSGFINYLRKELHNYKLDVVTKIDPQQNTGIKMAYTDADKYKALNEINPNLEILKKDFNLDL